MLTTQFYKEKCDLFFDPSTICKFNDTKQNNRVWVI